MLLEMIRFSHTLFALPFALLAACMAWAAGEAVYEVGWPRQAAGIVLCMVFARSAAMAFNRLADLEFDAANPRTAGRHLPKGLLSRKSVAVFALGCSAALVAAALLFWPNPWPVSLSVPVLVLLLGYSYAKRFTALAHFWLGAALMLAPVAAWIAVLGRIDWPPLVLGGAVLLWVAGFDIIYACQDAQFDRGAGLHSIPARLGVPRALRLAALCHVGMVAALAALPLVFAAFGTVYYLGIAGVAALLAYEHWLVRPDDLSRVNQAFFQVNAVVSLGLLAVGVADLLV